MEKAALSLDLILKSFFFFNFSVFLPTGTDCQWYSRAHFSALFVCFDRLLQSRQGSGEEAGDRTRAGCSSLGLNRGETVLI